MENLATLPRQKKAASERRPICFGSDATSDHWMTVKTLLLVAVAVPPGVVT